MVEFVTPAEVRRSRRTRAACPIWPHGASGIDLLLSCAETFLEAPTRCVSQASGGVPPFGHATHLRVFIDPDLLQYDEVRAAAGTWHDVFGSEPHQLVEASEGLVTDLNRG